MQTSLPASAYPSAEADPLLTKQQPSSTSVLSRSINTKHGPRRGRAGRQLPSLERLALLTPTMSSWFTHIHTREKGKTGFQSGSGDHGGSGGVLLRVRQQRLERLTATSSGTAAVSAAGGRDAMEDKAGGVDSGTLAGVWKDSVLSVSSCFCVRPPLIPRCAGPRGRTEGSRRRSLRTRPGRCWR